MNFRVVCFVPRQTYFISFPVQILRYPHTVRDRDEIREWTQGGKATEFLVRRDGEEYGFHSLLVLGPPCPKSSILNSQGHTDDFISIKLSTNATLSPNTHRNTHPPSHSKSDKTDRIMCVS